MPRKNPIVLIDGATGKQKDKRATGMVVAGRGDYQVSRLVPKGTFAKIGAAAGGALGGAAGTAAGGPLGAPGALIGAELGRRAGAALARIAGFGDYQVKENSLLGSGFSMPGDVTVPQFVEKGAGVRIRHREYVGDIVVPATPTLFTNNSFRINPAEPSLFPWLAKIAPNFQQYKIHGMVMEYKALSGEVTAGGALGAVMLATNYNANRGAYLTKVELENSEYAVSGKPSTSQLHAIECAPQQTSMDLKYVRSLVSDSDRDDDARMYDHGVFQIATAGLPGTAGAVLGELWVSYDIELMKADVGNPTDVGRLAAETGVSKTAPLGTDPIVLGVIDHVSSTVMSFNAPGQYLLVWEITGTPASALAITYSTDVSFTVIWDAGGSCMHAIVVKRGSLATFNATLATAVTRSDVYVSAYPYRLVSEDPLV